MNWLIVAAVGELCIIVLLLFLVIRLFKVSSMMKKGIEDTEKSVRQYRRSRVDVD